MRNYSFDFREACEMEIPMPSILTRTKVLLVDDEPSILASLADLLEPEFDVLTESDPYVALEHLHAHQISVLICDQKMPTMEGDRFLHLAREHSCATRVMLTGFADVEALARAVNDGGIYAYITKPWVPLSLRMVVRNAAKEYRLAMALRYERDLLRTLINNIPDCVYIQDSSLRYTMVNHAFAKLAGVDDPLLAVGKTELDCLPGEFGRVAAVDSRRVMETGQQVNSRCDEWSRGGAPSRWYASTRVPVRNPIDGNVEGVAGISVDITRHKENETYLKDAKDNAEETVRAKQEVLALATDQIRTPLSSLLAMADILVETDLPEQRRLIDQFRATGGLLTRFLSDLSDLARSDFNELELKQEEFSLFEVVQSVIESARALAEAKGLRITLDLHEEVPNWVLGDAVRIRQVFDNLVSNAVKFTNFGQISVVVKCITIEGDLALLEGSVQDTGPGIPADKLESIFEPFKQVDQFITGKHGGTGLGLTLCRRLARQMGGDIFVESSAHSGSLFRFNFSLPVAKVQLGEQLATCL
jgi:two-component system, cell cycle sensor histidine kinase PleC